MKIPKLKSKLNCIFAIVVGLILTANVAVAVILDDYNKYSPEELIVNDIIGNVLIHILYISVPMFIFGIIRDSKNKKSRKNFNMFTFIGFSLAYLFIAFLVLMIFSSFFLHYIYSFSSSYFIYAGVCIFLFILCLFAKISAKILNADFFIVLSLFIVTVSVFIVKGI